jgi:poly(3-hydroxybutyrate) depolymerase
MRCLAVAVALAAAIAGDARADAPPCDGCVFVPASHPRRPLIVLLHGDEQSPQAMANAFRATAAARDVALFAPLCPPARGCDRKSFWRWNEDAHWIPRTAGALVRRHHLDATRVYLVAWSGGAAYAGFHLRELVHPFAAIALLGGGGSASGCARRKVPVFMLSSELNPYRPVIDQARAHLVGCGHPLAYHDMPNRDHDDAWHRIASAPFQAELFDWLGAHALTLADRIDGLE